MQIDRQQPRETDIHVNKERGDGGEGGKRTLCARACLSFSACLAYGVITPMFASATFTEESLSLPEDIPMALKMLIRSLFSRNACNPLEREIGLLTFDAQFEITGADHPYAYNRQFHFFRPAWRTA